MKMLSSFNICYPCNRYKKAGNFPADDGPGSYDQPKWNHWFLSNYYMLKLVKNQHKILMCDKRRLKNGFMRLKAVHGFDILNKKYRWKTHKAVKTITAFYEEIKRGGLYAANNTRGKKGTGNRGTVKSRTMDGTFSQCRNCGKEYCAEEFNYEPTTEEEKEIKAYILNCQADDYDKLIQICDALATDYGFVILEKRFVGVTRRYGIMETYIQGWEIT